MPSRTPNPPANPRNRRPRRGEPESGAQERDSGGGRALAGHLKSEQETIFRWDAEERIVHIYSAYPAVWRKLERLGIGAARITTTAGVASGKFYKIPLTHFRWGLKSEARAAASKGRRPGTAADA